MNELRAPDPTLTALHDGETLLLDHRTDLPTAHLPGWGGTRCGHAIREFEDMDIIAAFARWFAVPCPDCFPDAPEPGYLPYCPEGKAPCGNGHCRKIDGLAWQVSA